MKTEKDIEEMKSFVSGWRSSGVSIREYSGLVGIPKGRLEYWVRKLRTSDTASGKQPEFIEISRCGEISKSNEHEPRKVTSRIPQVELTFPSGLCLKIYG